MTLYLQPSHLETIRTHGATSYPYECCGLLLGKAQADDDKQLIEVWSVENVWASTEHNPLDDGTGAERRYLIPPEAILAGEKHARSQGLEVIGYYHSHPDHPALPSEFDREYAWPWYSYIIVAVQKGQAVDLRSWTLDDDRQFRAEALAEPSQENRA